MPELTTLVVGAGGFIGSNVVPRLARSGMRAHGTYSTAASADARRVEGIAQHVVDLTDVAQVRRLFRTVRPRVVVNAAASRADGLLVSHAPSIEGATLAIALNVAQAAAEFHVEKFVQLASSMEYSPSNEPLSEVSVTEPISERGSAKLAATRGVVAQCESAGVSVTVLHLFRVLGTGDRRAKLTSRILQALETGIPVPTPSRETRRDYVDVDDVVTACELSAARFNLKPEIFNIGSGVSRTVDDVVDAFELAAGVEIPRNPGAFEARPVDVAQWCADISKARCELGWSPSIGLVESAARILRSESTARLASV